MTITEPEEPEFSIGTHHVRWELHDRFRGKRGKGISSLADEDFISSSPVGRGKDRYVDKLLDNVTFIYFGEGRVRDIEFAENNVV